MREVMLRVFDKALSACAWLKVESEEGIAAVEYGLLAALIAVVIITAVSLLGTNLASIFNSVATSI
jgi:pilus assembly protein Flp/PilA